MSNYRVVVAKWQAVQRDASSSPTLPIIIPILPQKLLQQEGARDVEVNNGLRAFWSEATPGQSVRSLCASVLLIDYKKHPIPIFYTPLSVFS